MSTVSPILFLVFNRPDTTSVVFQAIRAARPKRLYVAADGPRASRAGEAALCEEVRRIATAVDWPCELKILMRAENLGCKLAVSSAIDWYFEQEPEGIILEDDCVPDPTFFTYCDELLERYRDDLHVMCISGANFISAEWTPEESYYFSRYVHIWGWASWRRAWAHYDVKMSDWQSGGRRELIAQWFPADRRAQDTWASIFDRVAAGKIDTWDYQWVYACWRHAGLSCMPRGNLIRNIGFGLDATHTTSPESKLANLPVTALEMPMRHPVHVRADDSADRWASRHLFGIDELDSNFDVLKRTVRNNLRRVWASVVK